MCYFILAYFSFSYRNDKKKKLIQKIIRLMNDIKNKIIEEIKKIYDPEIPVNIYELGLIYKIEVDEKIKLMLI